MSTKGPRAPVLDGRTGREEKSPIHVADVMRMKQSNLRPELEGSESSAAVVSRGDKFVERKAAAGTESNGVERLVASKRVKFNMRESADLSEGEEVSESNNR